MNADTLIVGAPADSSFGTGVGGSQSGTTCAGTAAAAIAEARDQLPALVHSVESGHSIALTRRSKAVAVLLSIAEFERLQRGHTGDFCQAVEAFRAEEDLTSLDLAGALSGMRDASSGREVSW